MGYITELEVLLMCGTYDILYSYNMVIPNFLCFILHKIILETLLKAVISKLPIILTHFFVFMGIIDFYVS